MDIAASSIRSVPLGGLLFVLIALPILFGLLIAGARSRPVTVAATVVCAWALTIAALLLFCCGALDRHVLPFTPGAVAGVSMETILTVLDLALMAAFVAIGIARKSVLVTALAVAQLVPMAYFELGVKNHPEGGPTFAIDWLAIVMVMIVSIIGSIVAVYGLPYMKDHEKHLHLEKSKQPQFFLVIMLFLGAMNGLVMANNLLWLCFFWEITTLCSFLLIGHDNTEQARANATRALWMNLTGGVAFAAAILILGMHVGTLSLQEALRVSGPAAGAGFMVAIACLCFAGFTKAAQMPFQTWLLGAMVAPTPVSALLHSSTMVKAGVYLVVRLAPALQGTHLSQAVAIVGAFTFISGALLAIGQTNGKRVLAYSTISNLGLIIACAGLNSPLALTAAVMLIIFHAISKGLLFMAAGVVEHSIWSRDIEDMQGLVAKMPLTTALMVVGILSMLLPPFGVLIAKLAAIEAAINLPAVLFVLVLGSTFTLVFWTKWMGRLLTTEPSEQRPRIEHLHSMYFVPLLLLAAGAAAFSLLVAPILTELVEPAVAMTFTTIGHAPDAVRLSHHVVDVPWLALFGVLAATLLIPYTLLRGGKRRVTGAYMCGDQIAVAEGVGFRSVADQPTELTIHSDYFERYVGEGLHARWMTGVAAILLVLLFGVALPWK